MTITIYKLTGKIDEVWGKARERTRFNPKVGLEVWPDAITWRKSKNSQHYGELRCGVYLRGVLTWVGYYDHDCKLTLRTPDDLGGVTERQEAVEARAVAKDIKLVYIERNPCTPRKSPNSPTR